MQTKKFHTTYPLPKPVTKPVPLTSVEWCWLKTSHGPAPVSQVAKFLNKILKRITDLLPGIPLPSLLPLLSPPSASMVIFPDTRKKRFCLDNQSAIQLSEPVFQPNFWKTKVKVKRVQNIPGVHNALQWGADLLQLWPTTQELFWLRELKAFFSAAVEITWPCVPHVRLEEDYESFKNLNFLYKHPV